MKESAKAKERSEAIGGKPRRSVSQKSRRERKTKRLGLQVGFVIVAGRS